jgi:MFS superfamily sulfate permease-like transporter
MEIKKQLSLNITKLRGRNIMVALGYLVPTIIAIFFVGFFAPLVGIVVGFFIHIIVLLLKISKKLDKLMDRLEDNGIEVREAIHLN